MNKFHDILNKHTELLLFDGECSLCNGSVRYILRMEKQPRLSFASLGSEIGQYVSSLYFGSADIPDSIILIKSGRAYIRSEAAIRIATGLKGLFPVLAVFRYLPLGWRDAIYNFIARNRKRWFGTNDYCALDEGIDRSRFLDL